MASKVVLVDEDDSSLMGLKNMNATLIVSDINQHVMGSVVQPPHEI